MTAALRRLGPLVRAAKAVRSFPPVNRAATTLVRAIVSRTRADPDYWAMHLARRGPVRARLPNGADLVLWSDADWVANQVYWKGSFGYEPETSALFFELATRSRVTLDVGAHVGYYALLAGHANPNGTVLAFEPHPDAFERLRRHVALNGLANVRCVRVAAGETDGTADFYTVRMAGIPTSSSLSRETMAGTEGLVSFAVEVAAIDGHLRAQNADTVDLVKLDTEGTEPEVLRGMSATIEEHHPDIICEVLPGSAVVERELNEFARTHGYRTYLLTDGGPALTGAVHGDPSRRYRNWLFTVRTLA